MSETLVYQPYIFLKKVDGEWQVEFDWEDCFKGWVDEGGLMVDEPPVLSYIKEPIYDYIIEGDDYLSQFLKNNGVWDVSVY